MSVCLFTQSISETTLFFFKDFYSHVPSALQSHRARALPASCHDWPAAVLPRSTLRPILLHALFCTDPDLSFLGAGTLECDLGLWHHLEHALKHAWFRLCVLGSSTVLSGLCRPRVKSWWALSSPRGIGRDVREEVEGVRALGERKTVGSSTPPRCVTWRDFPQLLSSLRA